MLRPSGTEDLYRITIWGTDEKEIQNLAEKIAAALRAELEKKERNK